MQRYVIVESERQPRVIVPVQQADQRQMTASPQFPVTIDSCAALEPCEFVIKSVVEDVEVKGRLFDRIEAAVVPDVPIAEFQKLAEVLSACGHPGADVNAVFHGNWLRFFREHLPQ